MKIKDFNVLIEFFRKYPVALAAAFWILGLITGTFIKVSGLFGCSSFFVLLLVFVLYFIARKNTRFGHAFLFTSVAFFFLTGIFYANLFNKIPLYEKNKKRWHKDPVLEVKFKFIRTEKSTPFYNQYTAQIISLNQYKAGFKVLIKIPAKQSFTPGFDKIYIYQPAPGEWSDLPPPALPFGFRYDKYLMEKGIYGILKIKNPSKLQTTGKTQPPFFSELRRKIRFHIQKSFSDPKHSQILTALLLGERQFIDYEIKQRFIDAGVMHLLAISGLHIGILLMFLRILFRPFKSKKWLYQVFILGTLWFYAALTGFSPSVFRAVIMFSLFQLAWEMQRQVSSYYILLLAAFVILLFKPNEWQNPGFLLSFGAVASIVTFLPYLKKIYYPSFSVARYFVDLVYISIAAQIGIVPFLLYFFHRFSFGFLISNLLAIPLVSLVLITGFLMLPFWATGINFTFSTNVLSISLDLLLRYIEKIAQWKFFVIENTYFSFNYMIATFVLIFYFIYFLKTRRHTLARTILIFWIASVFIIADYYQRAKRHRIFLNHIKGRPALNIVQKNNLTVYFNDSLPGSYKNLFKSYAGISRFTHFPFPEIFSIGKRRFFSLNSTLPDSLFQRRAGILILDNSPKINLDLWINRLTPDTIIITPFNYAYLKNRWKNTARKNNIPFIDLNEKGYVTLYEK